MTKEKIIGGLTLIIACIGIMWLAAVRPGTKTPVAADTSMLTGTSYTEHAQYYDIAANYASSTPLEGAAGAAAVGAMKGFVADTIASFKKDGNFANLTAKDIQMMGFDKGRKESLQINYLIGSSVNTVSYIFTVYTDTLGAHGNMTFHTFTFDTRTGKELALGDLFTPGSDYLSKLSSIARAQLPGIIGEGADTDMIAEGTTPTDENFSDFFLDNSDLVILFAPYAVASHAAGPQTLRIPMSDLSALLKAGYGQY